MRRALQLARRAQGHTSPNPLVGAVVVKAGRIIAEGYHRRAGAPHAEADALRHAGRKARGATLYVTLEPCNHYGRTPPCCDAIIGAGVGHVVIGSRDPNPLTNGRGIAALRRAGVRVTTGILGEVAQELNAPFRKAMVSGMPLVIAKVGQSLDGKIATARGESRWITSPASRRLAHQWRSRVDAILVGLNTVRRDDPLLTVRLPRPGRRAGGHTKDGRMGPREHGTADRYDRPVAVVVDSWLRIPQSARCVSVARRRPVIVATTVRDRRRRAALERRGVEVLVFRASHGRVPLRTLCRTLARRGMQSVLIEGGGEVLASAFAERIVDRIVWFVAPILVGGRGAPGSIGGAGTARLAGAVKLDAVSVRRIGRDLCVEGRVVYPRRR
jgi:diaminohydroxyphosphoribosylaminopyrimidine deaminase/5-amino-6-(5-phosphoribosylamino)uracil reductase